MGYVTLPDNLTFEDFNRYANREPNFAGNWIYKVEQAFFTAKKHRKKGLYPKIEIDRREERYFLTYQDAVAFIQRSKPDDLYCSWVTQVPVGKPTFCFGTAWLFDQHGEMLDYTITNYFSFDESDHINDIDTVFFGRPQSRQRFKKGDIVEIEYRDKVTLAVVVYEVTDVEWCWDLYNRFKDDKKYDVHFYILDISDESMVVIEGPSYDEYHSHVSPLHVMKPRFPIPAELEAEMNTWIERMQREEEQEQTESNEFADDSKDNMLLEEIDKGDFTRFNNLDEIKQGEIMKSWSEDKLMKYYMQNTISEKECFEPVIKIIRDEA